MKKNTECIIINTIRNGFILIAIIVLMCSGVICSHAEAAISESPSRIDFYDENEIAFSLLTDKKPGENIVIPGLPDNLRRTDGVFSFFSSNMNGEGKKYYPGDLFTLNDECTDLFMIWESSVIQEAGIQNTQSFIQNFEKTNTRPNSYTIQGGALVVRDGKKYWVQAAVRDVTEELKESHSVDKAMNYTAIFIFDYDSGEIINSAFNIPFGHGNDLEYNPDLDKIIICSALEEGEAITVADWDLSEYECFSPEGTKGVRIVDCAYNITSQTYILTAAPMDSNYLNDSLFILSYDTSWQLQNKIASSFSVPENHYGFQGSCIYGENYYLVNFLKDNLQSDGKTSFKYARVSIYDLNTMSYIGSFPINVSDEIEDITVIGQTAYLNGQLYKEGNLYKYNVYEAALEDMELTVSTTTVTTAAVTTTASTATNVRNDIVTNDSPRTGVKGTGAAIAAMGITIVLAFTVRSRSDE